MASQKNQNKIRSPAGSPHPFTGPSSLPSAPASLGLLQAGAALFPPQLPCVSLRLEPSSPRFGGLVSSIV